MTTLLVLLSLASLCSCQTTWWKPTLGLSFQWQLQGQVDTNFAANVFDIDMFENAASVVDTLHQKGRIVVCYVSSQYENWRPDAAQFAKSDIGSPLDGWPGENWVNIKSANVRNILAARIQVGKSKNCDALEWDNVDPHQQTTGFNFNLDDTYDFLKFLADETHKAGMAVALKNNVESLARLAPLFDFAVNEQCFEYDECADYKKYFVDLGKPVFNVEYKALKCSQAAQLKITSVLKSLDLKALPYTLCNPSSFDNTRSVWPTNAGSSQSAGTTSSVAGNGATSSTTSTAAVATDTTDGESEASMSGDEPECRTRNGVIGVCATADDCEQELFPASSGATGCERLPVDVQCCATEVKSSGSCHIGGSTGVCTDTGACAKASGTATPASSGATGCESLPPNVQCCVFRALLRDDTTKPSSAPAVATLAALAVVVALALTLL